MFLGESSSKCDPTGLGKGGTPLRGEVFVIEEVTEQAGILRSHATCRLPTGEFPATIPPGDLLPLRHGVSADLETLGNLLLCPPGLLSYQFPVRRAGQRGGVLPARSLSAVRTMALATSSFM